MNQQHRRLALALTVGLSWIVCIGGCRSSGDDRPGGPVVRFRELSPVQLGAGRSGEVALAFDIARDHHIQANPAARETLIPATLELAAPAALELSQPRYPPGHVFQLEGSDWDLSTYDGRVEITVPVHAHATAGPGEHEVEGWFSYQACNRRSCLPPDRVPVAFTLRVTPP